MNVAPAKRSLWPRQLRYVFDVANPEASNDILLSSYETFGSRTRTPVAEKMPAHEEKINPRHL